VCPSCILTIHTSTPLVHTVCVCACALDLCSQMHRQIVAMNNDGTYDIAYEGTDEIDANVDVQYIRKVGSGRSSLVKKFRHAVHSISAVRAFASMGTGFGAGLGLSATAESKSEQ